MTSFLSRLTPLIRRRFSCKAGTNPTAAPTPKIPTTPPRTPVDVTGNLNVNVPVGLAGWAQVLALFAASFVTAYWARMNFSLNAAQFLHQHYVDKMKLKIAAAAPPATPPAAAAPAPDSTVAVK